MAVWGYDRSMDNLIEGIFANRQNPLLNLQAECFPKAQALAQAGLDYSWAFPWGVDPRMTPTVGAQVIDYAHKTLTSGQPFQLSGIVVNVFPSPQFKGCKVPVVVGNPLGLAVLPPDVNRAIGMLLAMGYAVVLDDTGRMAFPEAPSLPVEEG
jgi:hypothetical protein